MLTQSQQEKSPMHQTSVLSHLLEIVDVPRKHHILDGAPFRHDQLQLAQLIQQRPEPRAQLEGVELACQQVVDLAHLCRTSSADCECQMQAGQ